MNRDVFHDVFMLQQVFDSIRNLVGFGRRKLPINRDGHIDRRQSAYLA